MYWWSALEEHFAWLRPQKATWSKGVSQRDLKSFTAFITNEFAQILKLPPDTLVTPETPYHKRIMFTMLEFENLIDSSNIMVSDWVKIAKTIEENYK
jgi:hypothetical protein